MALPHAASGQPVALWRAGEDRTQFSSIALAKTAQLELIRLVLPKGKAMPEHKVAGEITLLCLEGELLLEAEGAARTLRAGEVLYLAGGVPHAVRAQQDSLALLTIVLA